MCEVMGCLCDQEIRPGEIIFLHPLPLDTKDDNLKQEIEDFGIYMEE